MELDETLPVLLLPGFMTDEALWAQVAPQLRAIGPLHYADLAGDSIAELAARALGAAPPRFLLIGFSLGGYVAREVARMVPGRVAALVLIATSARPDGPEHAQRRNAALAVPAASFRGLSRAALAGSLHPDEKDNDALIETIRAMNVRVGHAAFLRQSMLDRGDDRDRLGGIAVPTLVLAGDSDRLRTVAEAREMAQAIPGVAFEVIEHSGHMIPLEQPAALTAALLGWLERLPS